MSIDLDNADVFQPFIDRRWITDVLSPIRSGKEATVYWCQAHPATGTSFLAAKVYRAAQHRSFKNDAVYHEGDWRWRRPSRAARAFNNKSSFGREVQFGVWVGREWETLRALHAAGVAVPRPVDHAGSAILMEFLGDGDGPAPGLHSVRLSPEAAARAFGLLLADIERMLSVNVVHGDLSAFNVLWIGGQPRIIDLPQAVDPRFNGNARDLLTRDIENLYRYCARFGVQADPAGLAADLWRRFQEGRL